MSESINDIQILILGSSHSFEGINPENFEMNTFNLAHASQSIDYDYLLYKHYRNELINLKYLLIPISYFTFYFKIENSSEKYRVDYYKYYYFNNTFKILSLKRFGNNLKNILINSSEDYNLKYSGYYMNSGSKYDDFKQFKESAFQAAKRHTYNEKQDIFRKNVKIIETIIKLSINKGVKVVLIETPKHEEYLKHLNETQVLKTKEVINHLKSNYINSVIHLSYESDNDFMFNDFYDSDHLNGKGAEKLSKKINDYLMNGYH